MKTTETATSGNARIHLVWAAVFVTAAIISFFAYKYFLDKTGEAGSRLIDEAKIVAAAATRKAEKYAAETAAFAERAAEKFKTGQITQTFNAEIPVFHSAGFGRLEVGVSEATETFKKNDVRKTFWDWVYLGETIAEIKVPVTYRYHLDLGSDWKLSVSDKNCIVYAPALKPSLPVAIHTDRLQKWSSNGWARFDRAEQLESLQKTITPTLNENASKAEHLNNVREEARAVTARFIRAWLMREEQWQNDKLTSITVIFADESPNGAFLKPTLTYQP